MKTLEQHISEYAHYHRDKRNILTHYVGIPLIVFALLALLSRPAVGITFPLIGQIIVSPALIVWLAGNMFYVLLDKKLGAAMIILTGALLYGAHALAPLSMWAWLSVSIGVFVAGWVLQFIGHYFEGKKPAFVDDIMGLVIGPLFVVTEIAFELGLRNELKATVENNVGPTR